MPSREADKIRPKNMVQSAPSIDGAWANVVPASGNTKYNPELARILINCIKGIQHILSTVEIILKDLFRKNEKMVISDQVWLLMLNHFLVIHHLFLFCRTRQQAFPNCV